MARPALALATAILALVALAISSSAVFAQPKIPHGVEGRSDCLACHGPGKVRPQPADHAGRANETCLACHQPDPAAPAPTVKAPPTSPTAAPVAPPAVPTKLVAPTATAGAPGTTIHPATASATSAPASPATAAATPEPTQAPGPAATPLAAPRDSAGCLACHQGQDLAVRLDSGEVLQTNVSAQGFGASVHGSRLPCFACHPDKTTIPHQPVAAPDHIHYTQARIQVCAGCHKQVAGTYWDSVHGKLVAAGRNDAPTCVTCHSREGNAHTLQNGQAPDSPTADRNVASQVCGRCHAKALESYAASFHGRVMRLGNRTDAATCVDCHGAFGVQRVHGAEKPLTNEHLAQECAKCHPGAGTEFAAGWPGHDRPSPSWFPAAFFTERFLYFLTIGIVGFGIVHVELDTLRWVLNRFRRRGPGAAEGSRLDEHKEASDGN